MPFFTTEEQELIANAIADAEKATSGEIRIAVEKNCHGSAFERATEYFAELGMDKTAQHNGVLIYLAYADHKFAIIGDRGIDTVVPDDFWETTQVAMKAHFLSGNIAEGIIAGVALAGEKLALFFPYQSGDVNELPNDIIYMDQDETK
ncbi:TPM domain-containing protein [Pedobacter frigiditerrae]|uniref:TPM domain-containing protein n=1 Tax=Pedobacter frigiditerrae TaxID=2530452 RepID=A0A4V2MJK0_9SPHI|nr:TPM domain-containing protein [Pedobacter frigiditerrae]TCC94546.1 TPM domain-containing protein [Pedobacter frigiditerrae]